MKKCEWIVEETTGDHILISNGQECGRLPAGEETKSDLEENPELSMFAFEDLKRELEKECKC
jgi:hypothetical protein